jgi:hypothetical protein
VDSTDCVFSGCSFRDESEEGQKSGASLLELSDCKRISVNGCQLIDGAPWGLDAQQCSEVNVNGCTFGGDLVKKRGEGSIRFQGKGRNNLVSSCTIEGKVILSPDSGVTMVNSSGDTV